MAVDESGVELRDTETVDLADLRPHPRNYQAHPEAQIDELDASLREHGLYRNVVIARDGTILAGHGMVETARRAGMTRIRAVRMPYGPDDPAAIRLVVGDNGLPRLAVPDDTALAGLLSSLREADPVEGLRGTGYDDDSFGLLLRSLAGPKAADPNDAPEVPVVPVACLGDVWVCGDHLVRCGDAADHLDWLTAGGGVVITDPPYGIDVNTDWSAVVANDRALLKGHTGTPHRKVIGDDEPFDPSLYVAAFEPIREQFWFGGDYYRRLLSPDDLDGSWIVWDKRNEASDGAIGSNFELIWSRQRHKRSILRFYWFGAFGMDTARRIHPTQKPVALLREIIDRWAPAGAGILDPFGGSGSTLVAAQQTGHASRLVELDPLYVDVICRRWQEYTGIKPVLESTGVPHDFTATG